MAPFDPFTRTSDTATVVQMGEGNLSPQGPRPKESPLVGLVVIFGGILVLISLYMTIAPAVLMWRDGSGKVALGWFLWGMLWDGLLVEHDAARCAANADRHQNGAGQPPLKGASRAPPKDAGQSVPGYQHRPHR